MSVFWSSIESISSALNNLFRFSGINDIIDVLIMTLLIYEVIILVRNTRAQQLAVGMLILVLSSAVASAANLRTVSYLLQAVMNVGIIVLAIIFQPELRRVLEQVGGVNSAFARFFRNETISDIKRAQWEKAIVAICDAAENMAETRTGALIVVERRINLQEIIRTGTALNSLVSIESLGTIFYEGTPLHDGAVVIRDATIAAAGCFLPLSNNLELSKDMGTRHRSALGMSENSDAVVVVVSEERGIISLAKSGVMIRRLDRQNLYNLLMTEIVPSVPKEEKKGLRSWLNKFKKESAHGENQGN